MNMVVDVEVDVSERWRMRGVNDVFLGSSVGLVELK